MAYNYPLICEICKVPFNGLLRNQKTCGIECRQERIRRVHGRSAIAYRGLSSTTTGAIAELEASCDLMKKGYATFRALSPSCFCDILAIKGDKVFKIEVRTGYTSNIGKVSYSKKTHGVIDIFAVYERNTGKVFYRSLLDEEIEI